MTTSVALVWFRRDLRLHDHPALRAALDSARRARQEALDSARRARQEALDRYRV